MLVEGTRGQTPTILTWDKSWMPIEAKTSVERGLASFVEVFTSEFVCMYDCTCLCWLRAHPYNSHVGQVLDANRSRYTHTNSGDRKIERERERVVRDGRELRGMVKCQGLLYLGN